MSVILDERSGLEIAIEDILTPRSNASPAQLLAEPIQALADIPDQNRLPLYLTRFFGRDSEIGKIGALIEQNRLVTLTGPGGIGKTRLAVECARRQDTRAVFTGIADLLEAEAIPQAILKAHGLAPAAGGDAMTQLCSLLMISGAELLILDNAEHMIPAVVSVVLRLLQSTADLNILVTSRQRLDLAGEVVYAVQPLDSPDQDTGARKIEEYASVALFVDRACNSRPDFVLTPRHTEPVRDICRRLEGMPLAIELAATHISNQSPRQIASSLSASVMNLSSNQRGISARHRSLRAAIQGSYDLLGPDMQSVFSGYGRVPRLAGRPTLLPT